MKTNWKQDQQAIPTVQERTDGSVCSSSCAIIRYSDSEITLELIPGAEVSLEHLSNSRDIAGGPISVLVAQDRKLACPNGRKNSM